MKKRIINCLVLLSASLALCSYDIPKGWLTGGSAPAKYEMGVDKGAGMDGTNAATIRSVVKKTRGFGTLMQQFLPTQYRGKRVRMSGYLKTSDVKGWAGLWLRIDQRGSLKPLAFDNMWKRATKGTSEWTRYDLVLDIPQNASNMAFGALLNGTGQIWFDKVNFEIVDQTVPSTAVKL